MKTLVVGSTALKHWFPESRNPADLDIFSEEKIPGAETFWHPLIEKYLRERTNWKIAMPDELYTIKVSHAFWDVNWNKHMHDIMFLKSKGAVLIHDLYKDLYKVWEDTYGKKKANLNVNAEDFFKSTVKRIYDHDSIHASIAYYDEPLFNRILREGEQVAVSKAKFDALSYEDKCKLVREEVYATALERLIIPSDYKYSPKGAYNWAMNRTVTSFSKGWFPLFIVENYVDMWQPDIDYVKRHKDNKSKLIPLEA